jgi:hypothetical protein
MGTNGSVSSRLTDEQQGRRKPQWGRAHKDSLVLRKEILDSPRDGKESSYDTIQLSAWAAGFGKCVKTVTELQSKSSQGLLRKRASRGRVAQISRSAPVPGRSNVRRPKRFKNCQSRYRLSRFCARGRAHSALGNTPSLYCTLRV